MGCRTLKALFVVYVVIQVRKFFCGQDTRMHHTRSRGTYSHDGFPDSTAIQLSKERVAEVVNLGQDFQHQTSIRQIGRGGEGRLE